LPHRASAGARLSQDDQSSSKSCPDLYLEEGFVRSWLISKIALGVSVCAALGAAGQAQSGSDFPKRIDFNVVAPGKPALGFTAGLTGGRDSVSCLVQTDGTSPSGGQVLTLISSNRTNPVFPMCLHGAVRARDVDVSVRFKAVAGQLDQAAGIVLRAKDFDNYYVVRANALENNVRLYHVVAGRRTQFAGSDVEVPSGVWQSLRIKAEAAHFTVYLNDKILFEADDTSFPDAGRIGLWVKSDSVTVFDDFTILAAR
jgi:hypothetical protein